MRVTIVKDDGIVGVDGVFRAVDLSDLPADVHAVQWSDDGGEVEFNTPAKPNEKLTGLGKYEKYRKRWEKAGDVELTQTDEERRADLKQLAGQIAESKRREVLGDIGVFALASRLANGEVSDKERAALTTIDAAEKAVVKRIEIDTYIDSEDVQTSGLWT